MKGATGAFSGRAGDVDRHALERRLRSNVSGEVRFDPGSLGLYAQDGSNYFHVPLGVVLPRSADDVLATLGACREVGAPVVCRTGGTSLAGQASNEAVVVDFSKYMGRILEIDPGARLARVEPGVVCDALDSAAEPHGLTWGPKPATHSRCCFGGMIANNCGGMNAHYAGTAVHNVEALDVVLYEGTRMALGWMEEGDLAASAARGDPAARVFAGLRDLRDRYETRIRAGFPKLARRVSGYNLDELLAGSSGRYNLARTLVGTEGTCAITLEATVRLVDARPERVVVVLGYPDVFEAADHVPEVVAAAPDAMAVEGMDQRLHDNIRKKAAPDARYLDLLPDGHGWLFVQIGAKTRVEAASRGKEVAATLRAGAVGVRILEDAGDQRHLWEMRENGLGATAFVPGEPDTWEGWEDSAVPPGSLGNYLRDLDALYRRHGYHSVLYGHFGQGLVHCRVNFDLVSKAGIDVFGAFLEEASDLVAKKYRGSLSGEHGDGHSKAAFLDRMFGPELVRAFAEFKAIWDPAGKMNPRRIVHADSPTVHLRLGASYEPMQPATHFAFPADGGSFAHATLRCVGVGKCRNLHSEGGAVMCPSFMVTREERHSTRGRAHLLWEMLRGQGPVQGGFRDEAVKESLDLCLACKGCKSDCPVNVDMATYKAEFLAHYHEGRLRPRSAYAFGLIDRWARLAATAPGLANLVTQTPFLRSIARAVAGVHPERTIPPFARETFRSWFARRARRSSSPHDVLLWVDTFNDHFHPETAMAAVTALEHLGFHVVVPDQPLCCGRPLYDFGMLDRAERYLERVLLALEPHITNGTPMVVLEPSCCSVFRDELGQLMPNRNEAKNLAAMTVTLSEFIDRHVPAERLPRLRRKAIVQRHCHHQAVMGFDAEARVLAAMGLEVELLDSGCCGMAGSFGFERDKFEVSQACGERVLLPRVRGAAPDTLVLADGFSCKTQIAQDGPRRALHLAEVLALAIESAVESGEERPGGEPYVESAWMALAARTLRPRARIASAALVVAALVLLVGLAVIARLGGAG